MSLRYVDPLHLPSVPKSYRYSHGGVEYRIPWNNAVPWTGFYSSVRAFQERNGHPVASMEDVENFICENLPKGWCTGSQNYRPPAPARTSGCKSCGGWK